MILGRFITNLFPKVSIRGYTSFKFEVGFSTPYIKNFNELLSWPPNIFIILYSIIEYTDKYRILVSPQGHFRWGDSHIAECNNMVSSWKSYLSSQITPNQEIIDVNSILKSNLDVVFSKKNFNVCIYDLMNRQDFCESIFKLTIAIDKLFGKSESGITHHEVEDSLLIRDIFRLGSPEKMNQNIADNEAKTGVIARKYNIPQSGLTINNLAQNLTFIKPAVKYFKHTNKVIKNKHSKNHYNVLVIPWPFEVRDDDFSPANNVLTDNMDDFFDFFDYQPQDIFKPSHFLSFILSAIRRVGVLDLIVFPECSLSERQFDRFKRILYDIFGKNAPSLLSGVYGKNESFGKNSAVLAFIGEGLQGFDSIIQEKHHRWFLDRNQLRNYNLAATLNPGKKWWENIEVGRRKLTTLETSDGVILCPLVCEDLARQEPVAQAVRSIGPNLVISLLLDGPQISPRWPGKYAAVLSDDPGCSVLSVTALGMTQRATGLGHPPSKEVALWSEPGKGSETLQVSSTSGALVLELELEETKMWSLDGRFEKKSILRKKVHTTLELDFEDRNVSVLKEMIVKALKAGGNYA